MILYILVGVLFFLLEPIVLLLIELMAIILGVLYRLGKLFLWPYKLVNDRIVKPWREKKKTMEYIANIQPEYASEIVYLEDLRPTTIFNSIEIILADGSRIVRLADGPRLNYIYDNRK